jgi:hypothetical protein
MGDNMEELAKKGQKGLLLLAELSIIGQMGNLYTDRYLHKGHYRVALLKKRLQGSIQWVVRCMSRPRYFYKMFRMSPEVFMELQEMLISIYGLTPTHIMFYQSLHNSNSKNFHRPHAHRK